MHSCVFARSGRAAHLNILLPVDLRAAHRALSRLTHPSRVVVACASRVRGALGVSLPRVKRGRGAEEKRGGRRTSWSRGRSQNRWPHPVMYTSPSQMGFKHALHVCWKCAMAREDTRARASLTLGGDLVSFDSSPGVTQSPAVQLALLDSWRKLQAFASPRRFFGSISTLFADCCPYKRISRCFVGQKWRLRIFSRTFHRTTMVPVGRERWRFMPPRSSPLDGRRSREHAEGHIPTAVGRRRW